MWVWRGETDGRGGSKGSGSWSIWRWRHALPQRHAVRNQVVDPANRDRWTPARHRSRPVSIDLARARSRARDRESTGDCQRSQPAGGEAADEDTHLPQGGRSDVPSQSPPLARRQDGEELDAGHGEAGVPGHRRHARRSHRAGGCPANLEACLDDASRGGAEAPPAHPGDSCSGVRRTATSSRTSPGMRSTARLPSHVQCPKAPPVTALCGSSSRASRHRTRRGACGHGIRCCGASDSSKLCLEFLVLTATRSGEVRGALWEEFDLDQKQWSHCGGTHEGQCETCCTAEPTGDGPARTRPTACEGCRGIPIAKEPPQATERHDPHESADTVGLADRTTVHGFRSSFRTWASEQTDADHAVMELCLSHTVGSAVERAYARSDLLRETSCAHGAVERSLHGYPGLDSAVLQRHSIMAHSRGNGADQVQVARSAKGWGCDRTTAVVCTLT